MAGLGFLSCNDDRFARSCRGRTAGPTDAPSSPLVLNPPCHSAASRPGDGPVPTRRHVCDVTDVICMTTITTSDTEPPSCRAWGVALPAPSSISPAWLSEHGRVGTGFVTLHGPPRSAHAASVSGPASRRRPHRPWSVCLSEDVGLVPSSCHHTCTCGEHSRPCLPWAEAPRLWDKHCRGSC